MTSPLQAGLQVCRSRLDAGSAAPVAVAFSGGGDSLALLLAARAWARECGRPLLALHVDHGLQAASAGWAIEAEALARRLGVPFQRLTWAGDKPSTGRPAAARAARHRLVAEAARAAGASVVLLGHTLDDQLENALMRGAGAPVGPLREWSVSPAWPEGRGLFHCRPLLTVRRAALRDWLAAEGLTWIEDPANADPRHPRARARQVLNGGAGAELPPLADISALARACRVTPWGVVEIARDLLRAAPGPEALRLLQIALACASGEPGLARPARAQGLLERLNGPESFVATLGGARILASDGVRIVREAGEAARGGLAPIDLEPGETTLWDGRWAFEHAAPGLTVHALAGHAARMSPADAARLSGIPASDRPSLPVLRDAEGRVRLASLATARLDDHIEGAKGLVQSLVAPRFSAASGLICREDEIGQSPAWRNHVLHPMLDRKVRANG